jgi:hypothetical protein
VKGASRQALLLSWVTSVVITNICLHIVGATEYFGWVNICYLCMMCISYEIERMVLVSFMNLEMLRRTQGELLASQKGLLQAKKDHVRFIRYGGRSVIRLVAAVLPLGFCVISALVMHCSGVGRIDMMTMFDD